MLSFKELSCCWENVALYGWAGIPVDGGGLVNAWCGYTLHTRGERGAKGQRKFFMLKVFLSCHKIWILFHTVFCCAGWGCPFECLFSLSLSSTVKQHRKFGKGGFHLTIHHPSTFLPLCSLLFFGHTSVFKQNENCNQTVRIPSAYVPVSLFYKHVPPDSPVCHLNVCVIFHCNRNS